MNVVEHAGVVMGLQSRIHPLYLYRGIDGPSPIINILTHLFFPFPLNTSLRLRMGRDCLRLAGEV